jgi:hypothetical protein
MALRIYAVHILAPQAADKSHQRRIETQNGTFFFNPGSAGRFTPGSAGPRRFRLPITVGRMTAEQGKLRAEIVELSVERRHRLAGLSPPTSRGSASVVRSRMAATPHLFGFDMVCECGLAEADEHVRTARRYIDQQERLIERLADEGRILMTPSASSTFEPLFALVRALYRVFLNRVSSLQR